MKNKKDIIKLNQIIELIKKGVKLLQVAKSYYFADFIKENWRFKNGKFEFAGIYAIYEKGKGLIYIGSAGKGNHFLRYRIADLFYFSDNKFKHYLTEKLLNSLKRFDGIDSIRNFYLHDCYFRVVKTDTIRQARIIEEILIYLLNPKYNQD